MNTKQTFTAALITAGLLAAAPAFAQDSMKDDTKDKAETVMKDKMDAVTIKGDTVTESVDGTITVKGDPVTIETPEQIITAKDGEMTSGDSGMMIKGSEIMVKGEGAMTQEPTLTTTVIEGPVTTIEIACPEGTEAQPDGTCMMVGEVTE